MVASVASFGSLNLAQARAASADAVMPVPAAPVSHDRPQPAPQPVVSAVALAPAAMSALIEAQANLSQPAPLMARETAVHTIDQLIYRLDAGATTDNMPFEVRRLQAARQALVQSPIDIKA